ncbi:MAG: mechanosensitive ion channel domain-containing protein [Planctomycetota bacterium]
MPSPLKTRAILLGLAGCLAQLVGAQQQAKPEQLNRDAITAAIAAVGSDKGLSDGERSAAIDSYTKALEAISLGDASATRAQALLAEKASARERLSALRVTLAQTPSPVAVAAPVGATLADIEQFASGAEEAARQAITALDVVTARIEKRSQQQPQMPQLIAAARERLLSATALSNAATKQGGSRPMQTARRTELLAQVYAAAQSVFALESELDNYEGSEELLTAERDRAIRQSERTTAKAKAWKNLVQERRLADAQAAERSATAAVAASEDRHPLVAQLAQENEALAQRRSLLAREFTSTAAALERSSLQLAELEQDFQDVSKRLKAARLTDALGALLRDRRTTMPDRRKVRGRIDNKRDRIAALQLRRVELDDDRRTLKRREHVEGILASLTFRPTDATADVRREVSSLMATRLETVEVLRNESGKLFDSLIRLDDADRQLMAKIDEYVDFINARVLWARSTTPIWNPSVSEFWAAAGWLCSPSNWWHALSVLGADLANEPMMQVLALLLLVVLVGSQRRVRRALRAHGELSAPSWAVDFSPTAWTLLLTILAALPLPLAMWLIGWRLEVSSTPTAFARSLSHGLCSGAALFLAMEVLRQIVRPYGLAASHFAWSPQSQKLFRRGLLWLTPLAVTATTALVALEHKGETRWTEGLGRPVLLVALTGLAAFFWRLLHLQHGLVGIRRIPTPASGWASRLRLLWLVLGVGIPASLVLLDALGFHFTAVQLTLRFGATTGLVVVVLLLHDIILRALVLARRKLAKQQAGERRQAAAAAKSIGDPEPAKPAAAETTLIDATSVAEQTRSLVRSMLMFGVVVGAWVIWVDVLPALGVFNDVPLWDEITLSHAILSTIALVMTFLAARNIPGVLHLTLLQRLQMHEGERHAITTIARYAIILVGVAYAFSNLGMGWGKLQWLAAGISVGLGFGLQEIFANFVSGLIILFERPVRVGDLVTVNGTDGYVTRIKMRATTIRDYNRKELVVPNKEFITGSIVNWTLSDSIARLIIKVGVAYGSDTLLCRELLLKVAAQHAHVLDKPRPKALFMSFGESSLDFQLRVFTSNVDVWPEVIDALHRNIDDEFRKAGIEIAFPQRDLHIRTNETIAAAVPRLQRATVDPLAATSPSTSPSQANP